MNHRTGKFRGLGLGGWSALTAAVAWLTAAATDRVVSAAVIGLAVLILVAVPARRRRRRWLAVAGFGFVAAVFCVGVGLLVTGVQGGRALALMVLLPALLGPVVPLLYAATSPDGPGEDA